MAKDMYQKRKERQEKKSNDASEKNTININWYPGHMAKAKREMQEKIKLVDLVIEIRDARIPLASQNPMLKEITNNKPRLLILAKSDKADERITQEWVEELSKQYDKVVALDLLKGRFINQVGNICNEMMKEKIERQIRKNMKPLPIRAMIFGIPNVGKSTFINTMSKRKLAKTGDKPGVTKSLTWVKINPQLEFMDTPGVLWPKFEDVNSAMSLAITGAIPNEILPLVEMSNYALEYLIKYYPNQLMSRFKLENLQEDNLENFKMMAIKRGYIQQGQQPDLTRCRQMLINEIRNGSIGRISWETVNANSEQL